jgi:hypothetical protein
MLLTFSLSAGLQGNFSTLPFPLILSIPSGGVFTLAGECLTTRRVVATLRPRALSYKRISACMAGAGPA